MHVSLQGPDTNKFVTGKENVNAEVARHLPEHVWHPSYPKKPYQEEPPSSYPLRRLAEPFPIDRSDVGHDA